MNRDISLPLQESVAIELQAGDEVTLTGFVLTGRDQACARLFKMIQGGAALPVDLAGQVLYFVGPSPPRPGAVIGSAGPTTSGRMAPFIPALLASGLRGFIGKGYIDATVKRALAAHRAVYFGAVGGTGALLSARITSARVVAFPDLLSEAVHSLRMERFPAVVLCDTHGVDWYARILGATSEDPVNP
jgi:fumarate hydratase subunit beta